MSSRLRVSLKFAFEVLLIHFRPESQFVEFFFVRM